MPSFYAEVDLVTAEDGSIKPDLPADVTDFAVVGVGESDPTKVIVETTKKVNSFQNRRKALPGRPTKVHTDAGMGRPDRDKSARDAATLKDRERPDHPLNRK